MASRHSLRRVASLTKKVHDDLRRGGMGMTFRYLFRSTAILARVVAILADHVATQAEQAEGVRGRGNALLGDGTTARSRRADSRVAR